MNKKVFFEKSLRNLFLSNRKSYIYVYMIFVMCLQTGFSYPASVDIHLSQAEKVYFPFLYSQHSNIISQIEDCNFITKTDQAPTCTTCPQADITISVNTTWSNLTVNMCTGQSIIVNNDITFNVIGTTIQLDPSQSGKWSGIKVNSNSTFVLNGSTLKQANVAITGNNAKFIRIISNSNIIESNQAISATATTNGGGFPVYILQSNLENTSGTSKNLVYLLDVNMQVIKSKLTNNAGGTLTGIQTFNDNVSLQTVVIKDFYYGITKNVGGGFSGSSLYMYYCDVLGANTSIYSRDMNVNVSRSILSGLIDHSNRATGTWRSNNFLGSLVKIDNPSLSFSFIDNRFGSGTLTFSNSQAITDATCNFWDHCGVSVDGSASIIKSDWGKADAGSRNKHANGCTPIMRVSAANDIIHHHRNVSTENFNHLLSFSEEFASSNANCPGLWRSVETGLIDDPTTDNTSIPSYDETQNNSEWNTYHQTYLDVLTELNGEDPSTDPELRMQLEDAQVGMGQCVSAAFAAGGEGQTQSEINTWISRADPLVEVRSTIIDYLVQEDFSTLITYLNSLSLSGQASTDRYNLKDAIVWMQTAKAASKDIYNLSSSDLDDLSSYADLSFENYTEVLRGWLNMHYNLFINQPPPSSLQKQEGKMEAQVGLLNDLLVSGSDPECLLIHSKSTMDSQVEIIDIEGRILFSKQIMLTGQNCLKTTLTPGLYKIKISSSMLSKPIIRSYFVK